MAFRAGIVFFDLLEMRRQHFRGRNMPRPDGGSQFCRTGENEVFHGTFSGLVDNPPCKMPSVRVPRRSVLAAVLPGFLERYTDSHLNAEGALPQ